jgi:protoporphyrinogen oxidase
MSQQITNTYADICIVGGGISGLYAAYRYKKQNPRKSFILLEKSAYIGGRVRTKSFGGTKVVQGAGVGRFFKDDTLFRLADELKVPTHVYDMNVNYDKHTLQLHKNNSLSSMIKTLEDNVETITTPMTFSKYATNVLGVQAYHSFVKMVGYSDFENTDAYYAVKHYGFDDVYNHNKNKKFFLDWDLLLERIIQFIGRSNIVLGAHVTEVNEREKRVRFVANGEDSIRTVVANERIVLAVPMPSLQKLVPKEMRPLYSHVNGQPFLYVYAKLSKDSTLQTYVPSYSVVHSPLQKVIPIDAAKGVFMIAYLDNKNTDMVRTRAQALDIAFFEKELTKIFPKATVHIEKLWKKHWTVGTHYFSPFYPKYTVHQLLSRLQHPHPNVTVVGEAVSVHQGWVEGALQSVHRGFIAKKN